MSENPEFIRVAFFKRDIVIDFGGELRVVSLEAPWAEFSNTAQLFERLVGALEAGRKISVSELERNLNADGRAPLDCPAQLMMACGVTYFASEKARDEEFQVGGDRNAVVSETTKQVETPYTIVGNPKNFGEVFPKGYQPGHFFTEGQFAGIRQDSGMGQVEAWDVHEAEFGVIMTSSAQPVGFFLGYDMSSRSIEGKSPLLLPHAKTYKWGAGVSRWLTIPRDPQPFWETLQLETWVEREGSRVFGGKQDTTLLRRPLQELCNHVYRLGPWEHSVYFMTGTNVVPKSGDDFTLREGDVLRTVSPQLGEFNSSVKVIAWEEKYLFKASK